MDSAIEEFYYATRGERENAGGGRESEEQLALAIKCDAALKELLKDDAEASEVFERYKEALAGYGAAEACANFKEGFRCGLRVGLEASENE